jgi:uncharacterized protein YndB with AHSA1/START domain
MPKTQTLSFKRTIQAPAAEVYRAFTNATALTEWMCNISFTDPQKGGRIYAGWNDGYHASGAFTNVDPVNAKRVAFSWHGSGEPAATQVRVLFKEKKGATTMSVTHSGFGSGPAWTKAARDLAHGWESGLENLQSVLETGEDLRLTLRPMVGLVGGDELDPELNAKLGLPAHTRGLRLNGVVEGMGLHRAGLGKDDVLVGLGGKKVTGWNSLVNILQQHRAGDKIAAVFYRHGQKQTVTMELSKRPLPPVPTTAAALAEIALKLYDELDAKLAQCFEGVSEAETARRPAPGEWSAKEVVAHLLAGERDWHSWITELMMGVERQYSGALNNSQLRTEVIANAQSAPALLAELKRLEREAVALLAGLPPEFVARKGTFWRLAYGVTQSPFHNDDHLNQIRAAIASAQKK